MDGRTSGGKRSRRRSRSGLAGRRSQFSRRPWMGRSESLAGRTVVLGVSGGIAAYKAVEVCRRLFDAGAHVAPIITEDATRFIGPLTFSALASEPARTSLWDAP